MGFSNFMAQRRQDGVMNTSAAIAFVINSFQRLAGLTIYPKILCSVLQCVSDFWGMDGTKWSSDMPAIIYLQIWVDIDKRIHGDVKLALQFIDLMDMGVGMDTNAFKHLLVFCFIHCILGGILDNMCKQKKLRVDMTKCISYWLLLDTWGQETLVKRYEACTQSRVRVENDGQIKEYHKRLRVRFKSTFQPTPYALRQRRKVLGEDDLHSDSYWLARLGLNTKVAVGDSTIADAGMGCFTQAKFRSGDKVAQYKGTQVKAD